MREEMVKLELSKAEVALLAAALGNTNRDDLSAAVKEDYGNDVANEIIPMPEQGGLIELIEAMSNDLTSPLYDKLHGIVKGDA